jgi:hypothetical protein
LLLGECGRKGKLFSSIHNAKKAGVRAFETYEYVKSFQLYEVDGNRKYKGLREIKRWEDYA